MTRSVRTPVRSRAVAVLVATMVALGTMVLTDQPASAATRRLTVSGLSARSGATAGGTRVTIHGHGFSHVKSVRFGRSKGRSLRVLSSSRLQVTAPRHNRGTVNVRVTTRTGTSRTHWADRFGYVSAPAVSRVAPTSGPLAGGTRLTISGSSFVHVKSVTFGSSAGRSLHVLSSTRLQVTAPKHASGRVDVRVTTAYGRSRLVTTDHYVYVAPPSVTSVTANGGLPSGGGRITVYGTNFTRVTAVKFGTASGSSISVLSASRLQVRVPAHPVGTADVRVTTAYGQSPVRTADRYTYLLAPQPVEIAPIPDSLNATTLTLSWQRSPSAVAGVMIRRADGALAPSTPTSGTLVANVPAATTTFTDTGLTRNSQYSYALFAYTSVGPLYSGAATVTGTTPNNSYPDVPTMLDVIPTPKGATGGSCAGDYGWVGASADVRLVAHVADPDGAAQRVRAEFTLSDLGGDGAAAPVDVIGSDDPAGSSDTAGGDGGTVVISVPSSQLIEGHLYAMSATAFDGTVLSAAAPACHFWYDTSAPSTPTISSIDFPTTGTNKKAGQSGEFDVSASDVMPAGASYSGIDHFVYATDPSRLAGGGGTHVAATASGPDATGVITLTPTTWGTNYLYVAAVDKAGNQSATATYSFFVSSG